MGLNDRRFSRALIPMVVDRGAVIPAPRALRLRSVEVEAELFGRPTCASPVPLAGM